MNWLDEIVNVAPFKKFSQNGEEGVLGFILHQLGIGEGGYLIDLGASDGWSNSNSRWLLESCNWTGLLLDGDPQGSSEVTQAWVDVETIGGILQGDRDRSARDPDLLLIDLDGNDYWILDAALKTIKPKLIVCEINPALPWNEAITMPYDPAYVLKTGDFYGMSYGACDKLAKAHLYTIIHVHHSHNAFLLRDDLLPGPAPVITPAPRQDHAHTENAQWQKL